MRGEDEGGGRQLGEKLDILFDLGVPLCFLIRTADTMRGRRGKISKCMRGKEGRRSEEGMDRSPGGGGSGAEWDVRRVLITP